MLRDQIASERNALRERVLALLPDRAPGLGSRAIYLGITTWSPERMGKLLRQLESEGDLTSALVPHERPQLGTRRQFWRRLATQ